MRNYAVISVLMLGLVVNAEATLQKGDQFIAIQPGLATPLSFIEFEGAAGDEDLFANTGGTFGVQYLYHVIPMLGVGMETALSGYGERESDDLLANASSESRGHNFEVMTVVRGAFIPQSRVHPYVEGGFGISRTTLKVESTPDASHVWADSGTREKRTLIDSSKTGAAMMIGGGVDFFINEHFFIGASGRLMFNLDRTYDPTASGVQSGFSDLDGTLATFNSLFRLGWKF